MTFPDSYTVERTYPAADWRADPEGILRTFRADAAAEAAQHGHAIEDVANVTAYLEDAVGNPTTVAPTRVRFVAVWLARSGPTAGS